MFFRRERPKQVTFEERLERLRKAGFSIQAAAPDRVRVTRTNCAADIETAAGCLPRVGKAGVLAGGEIGLLVDGGFQKFFQTPDGRRAPALASDLKALHDFQEDLREALGEESLYNEALGTTCDLHIYDRLEGRG